VVFNTNGLLAPPLTVSVPFMVVVDRVELPRTVNSPDRVVEAFTVRMLAVIELTVVVARVDAPVVVKVFKLEAPVTVRLVEDELARVVCPVTVRLAIVEEPAVNCVTVVVANVELPNTVKLLLIVWLPVTVEEATVKSVIDVVAREDVPVTVSVEIVEVVKDPPLVPEAKPSVLVATQRVLVPVVCNT
jgi:hypothetical protein